MPSLILFRHGKSDWHAGQADDLARPLSQRGRRGARTMGRFLGETGQVPDRALSSPAERARQTMAIAMQAGGWTCEVGIRDALYGGAAGLLEELRGQAPPAELLLAVGHEPAWSEAVELLIGGGRVKMPTAALARIDLEVGSWAELEPGCGELAWLVHPRLFATGKGGRAG